jgi:hypothetical protein
MATIRQRGANEPPLTIPNSNTYPSTKTTSGKALTSERIASDIEAFNKAGGRIEVLGTTPLHRRPEETQPAADTRNAASSTKKIPDQK